ncbi:MAG: deoxyribodipyrimidine photolyase [Rhodobacteraceae bacterium]|nr:deoxyribodipyrimidine photolyase [Paracoccaceae bacterium]
MTETVLLWFKRDLRVADHPALAHAAKRGRVLPLFIVEPDLWAQSDMSARQFFFVRESVMGLRRDLAQIGLDLCLRVGPAVQVLADLQRQTGATLLVSHEETGNGFTYSRDKAVAEWASANGMQWEELPQSGVVRRLKGRNGWSQARNAFMRQVQVSPPQGVEQIQADSQDWPELGFVEDCAFRQAGGRDNARKLLSSFLASRGELYRKEMSSPLGGASACSRLSPHLAHGTLSVREVAQIASAASRDGRSGYWLKSLSSFQSRLAWRDHFMQKLEDQPELEHACMHPAYEHVRTGSVDMDRLKAWAKGETGIPFVDACMRCLNATGWLNFRMRSMLMSFASYHLWLDWRQTGLHLARQFTDFEAGIHWPQVQMQSGTTGMNTIRIYNPVKQGHDQDPLGRFTRKWVPELKLVPDANLQDPWRWAEAGQIIGKIYPQPIIDPESAAREARALIWSVRRKDGFGAQAKKIVDKHASRAGRTRRRKATSDRRQLSLDL